MPMSIFCEAMSIKVRNVVSAKKEGPHLEPHIDIEIVLYLEILTSSSTLVLRCCYLGKFFRGSFPPRCIACGEKCTVAYQLVD